MRGTSSGPASTTCRSVRRRTRAGTTSTCSASRRRAVRAAARALAELEQLADRRLGAVVLFVLGLAVYALRAAAWPLIGGRDLDEYLYGYVQFLDWHPLLPWSMQFRTPAPALVDGAALDVAHGMFAEPLMAVMFAGSVVAWAAAARAYGPRSALLVAAALLVYPACSSPTRSCRRRTARHHAGSRRLCRLIC